MLARKLSYEDACRATRLSFEASQSIRLSNLRLGLRLPFGVKLTGRVGASEETPWLEVTGEKFNRGVAGHCSS